MLSETCLVMSHLPEPWGPLCPVSRAPQPVGCCQYL